MREGREHLVERVTRFLEKEPYAVQDRVVKKIGRHRATAEVLQNEPQFDWVRYSKVPYQWKGPSLGRGNGRHWFVVGSVPVSTLPETAVHNGTWKRTDEDGPSCYVGGTPMKTINELTNAKPRKTNRSNVYIGPGQVTYSQYLGTLHWRKKRHIALLRARRKCQVCATTHGLSVHHNSYERIGNEHVSDLFVMCDECHDHAHLLERVPMPTPYVRITEKLAMA